MKKFSILLLNILFILSLFGCSSVNDSKKYANPLLHNNTQSTEDKNSDSEEKTKSQIEDKVKTESNIELKTEKQSESAPLTNFTEVANHLAKYGKLPENYITKSQASALGWVANKGNLAEVAPGKSIGGDVFTNRQKVLPDTPGRIWYEADIDYTSGFRNSKRILYSNDGLIYKTIDHYATFTRLK